MAVAQGATMHSCVDQSVFCALGNQAALEMRNGAEDMEHQLTCGGRRIDPQLPLGQNRRQTPFQITLEKHKAHQGLESRS